MHSCSVCGKVSPTPRCPAHTTTTHAAGGIGWGANRDRVAQAQFRRMLINRDGPVCQGCGTISRPLQAHHDTATDGRMLCDPCHREADDHAR